MALAARAEAANIAFPQGPDIAVQSMNFTGARLSARGGFLVVLRLLLALLAAAAVPRGACAAELTVTIDNVRNDKGVVRLSVYASPGEWPDKSAKAHDQVKPAKAGPVTFKFNLPPGVYAVNAYHDENNNNKFDTTLLGLPLEGYGFSNDVRPTFKAPSFNSAAFELLPAGGVIHFSLVYP